VLAAVLTGRERVELEDRPEPEARPGWVVVQVESASICGTDTHQYEGRVDTPYPRVPGHDFAGRVTSVGDGVDPGLVGTPVAVKPSLPCTECPDCAEGRPADCHRKKLMGLWSDGCFTERVAVPGSTWCPGPTGSRPGRPPCWSRWPSGSIPSTG
jgi:threonine dehydrogenase-like Zn-dependent dehydrogenase